MGQTIVRSIEECILFNRMAMQVDVNGEALFMLLFQCFCKSYQMKSFWKCILSRLIESSIQVFAK